MYSVWKTQFSATDIIGTLILKPARIERNKHCWSPEVTVSGHTYVIKELNGWKSPKRDDDGEEYRLRSVLMNGLHFSHYSVNFIVKHFKRRHHDDWDMPFNVLSFLLDWRHSTCRFRGRKGTKRVSQCVWNSSGPCVCYLMAGYLDNRYYIASMIGW
jgi:hypothetical protein